MSQESHDNTFIDYDITKPYNNYNNGQCNHHHSTIQRMLYQSTGHFCIMKNLSVTALPYMNY